MLRVLGGIAFAGLLTALLLEGLVRLALPQVLPRDVPGLWYPDETIGWRHHPEVRLSVNTGERDVDICTDVSGDRVSCDPAQARPEPCRKRVLAIGDSFVEALAIPFEQTVWRRIEREFDVCVFVSGVGAWGPGQYLKHARERLAEGSWDLVLYAFYAGNDFVEDPEEIPPPTDVQRRPFRLLPAGLSLRDLRDWFYPFNSWLESHSHAYVAMRFAIRRFRDPGDVGIYGVPAVLRASRMGEALLSGSARSIALAAEEAERHGVPLLVVLIPHRAQVLDPAGEKLVRGLPRLAGDVDMDLVSREFVPRLRAVAEIDGVVDLTPFLREHATPQSWGTRDQHLSPDGHGLWFEAVKPEVARLLEREEGQP